MGVDNTNILVQIVIVVLSSSVLSAIITNVTQWFKWNDGEKTQSAATSAKTIAEASKMLIEPLINQIEDLNVKMDAIELKHKSEIEQIKRENRKLEGEYKKLEKEFVIMKDWAERLVYQVKSLGAEPVSRIDTNLNLDEIE